MLANAVEAPPLRQGAIMRANTLASSFGAAVLLLLAAVASGQVSGPTFHFETIARTGDPAPGTSGAIFDRFGLFPGVGSGELRATIDDGGTIAFHAFLGDGDPVTAPTSDGIWKKEAGLVLVALRGAPAPGTSSTFTGFPSPLVPGAPDVHGGKATFAGEIAATPVQHGIWSERFGSLARVLLTPDTLPDTPAGSTVFQFAYALRGTSIFVNVRYALASAGSVGNDTEGLWVNGAGTFQTIAVKDMPAPGTGAGIIFASGTSLAFFGAVDAWNANRNGQAIFNGYLGGSGIDTLNDEGIWQGSPGQLSLLFREGQSVPGQTANVKFGSNTGFRAFGRELEMLAPILNERGTVLFGSVISGPNFDHILPAFLVRNGQLQMLARASSSLPGTPPGDPAAGYPPPFTYARFGFGALNNSDEVVILGAATTGDPLNLSQAIWRDSGAGLQLVAGVGRPVPAFPGHTFAIAQSLGFGDLGLLYYSGRMTGPEVDPANDDAIFVQDTLGRHSIVLREGDPLDLSGNGTDVRIIADFIAGNGISDAGAMPVTLTFTDGTIAIVKVEPDLPLTADARLLSTATGGTVLLHLDAGLSRAGRPYVLGGSASGTSPGIDLGGGLIVPLNLDDFLPLTIGGDPHFIGFAGSLDVLGRASAGVSTLGPLPPSLAGLNVHFAYVVLAPLGFVSNPVPLTVVP
jgi:hypothetical protein